MGARAFKREVELFGRHDGGLRMSEALRLGINRKALYTMRDAGIVEVWGLLRFRGHRNYAAFACCMN